MDERKPNQNRNNATPPPWAQDNTRIDVNLIAMLLWQALLTGISVSVSHMNWYLPDASAGEMGLQYGLIAFGFLCTAMVLFHVGGIRDSLAIRAELSQEHRYDKWYRTQMRMQQRRSQKRTFYDNNGGQQLFGVLPWGQSEENPNNNEQEGKNNS